jgi:hypothetical protein
MKIAWLAIVVTVAAAGCGGQTRTVTATTPAPKYSARDTSVKAHIEDAITKRVTQAEIAAGDGSTFDPNTATTCIATSDTALACQASTDGQTQTWTATVDTSTGVYGIQPG